ncbi:MAG: histidine phosphatase family protein [Gracilimonas sp.]|uniref:SixA phosphatase family protein n=1 Tax=Gracilimonas TaxID=649462 RepID=UPI001B2BB9C4|nr:phosphoglycerate mutase family protein [Gracilimonas sp.]MBO6586431.1 histidine phosphatase family protein [Gracilimonas sp.]MBO6615088.1 histidine phosphatase family protein [Gracilimonas sp.]
MKKLLLIAGILLITLNVFAQSTENTATETTLIFVRHAEKMDDGTRNPHLSEEGKSRAVRLADILLKEHKVSAVYSTPYYRTKETASPIADSLELEIREYGLDDPKALVQSIIDTNKGSTALIVGHSNTTPLLVNLSIGEQRFEQINEKAYGDIFIVTIAEGEDPVVERISY